ncbi:MAG: diacylglycerol kinase family lipid kinase [Opitutaceae bacterium]
MKVCFIINPVSGHRRSRDGRGERLDRITRQMGVEAGLWMTERRGHAGELSRRAVMEGYDRVVSVGGDGTMNEVAAGLVGTGVPLGLIPLGSGNGLARDLGLPLAFDRAVVVALQGRVRVIDSGSVNGKPFFNIMGMGFDAELGRRFNSSSRRGFLTYLRLGTTAFFGYAMQTCRVEAESAGRQHFQAFLLSVANSTQFGNGARVAPRARLDDGRLDLVAVTTAHPVLGLGLAARLFAGTFDRSRHTVTLVGERFRIVREKPGPVHTDGEIHEMGAELLVEVHPGSLRVVVS